MACIRVGWIRAELDSDGKLFGSQPNRLRRIARGAGVSVAHVNDLIATYRPFKAVASKLKGLGKGGPMDLAKMGMPGGGRGGKNPQINARQLQSMFTPQMLQQMGGLGNIQNMMKKFASGGFPGMPNMPGMGGMPDMDSMLGGMGGDDAE